MCFDDPSGPMSLTAKEDGPRDMVSLSVLGNERERTSGTSENALPGHARDRESASDRAPHGSPRQILASCSAPQANHPGRVKDAVSDAATPACVRHTTPAVVK